MIIEPTDYGTFIAEQIGPKHRCVAESPTRWGARNACQAMLVNQYLDLMSEQHRVDRAVKTAKVERLERWAELREDRTREFWLLVNTLVESVTRSSQKAMTP